MNDRTERLFFASDYMEGAHPAILERLLATNGEQTAGYGLDPYSESARGKIRMACAAPNANVHFLLGGTQANATVIDAVLCSYEGVLAAASGHISVHEAGAIEYGGHKVLALPHEHGKLSAATIEAVLAASRADENRDHMVFPGMVYLSQPTECGTLYTREELTRIHAVCRAHDIPLYLDGARLAYALACPENDVTLPDIARLCDIFYIGGTKCGALFGEAVVLPNPSFIPHFFTIIKQHGALLAKGRIAGIQFDTLFTDGLYEAGGATAIKAAARIRQALHEKRIPLAWETPTNQIFIRLTHAQRARLESSVALGFWEQTDDAHVIMRIATSWATTEEQVSTLIARL